MKRTYLAKWAWVCVAACLGGAMAAEQQQGGSSKNRQKISKEEDKVDSRFQNDRTAAERGQYVEAPDTGSEDTSSDTYKIFQAVVKHDADALSDLFEDEENETASTQDATAREEAAQSEEGSSKKRSINPDTCFGNLTKEAQDSLNLDPREFLVRAHIGKLGSLTPLALAAYYGDEKMVDILLDKGKAAAGKTVLEKQTPLMLAAFGHNKKVVERLLKADDADAEDRVTEQDAYGMTVMHYAIIARDRDILNLLVGSLPPHLGGDKSDAPVNTANMMGYTPLHYAAQLGDEVMFNLLLDKGADYTLEAKDGETALMAMCACGHTRLVKDFLLRLHRDYKRMEVLNAQDKRGNTAVLHAIRNNREDVAKALILEGADLRLKNEADQTALMFAAAVGNTELILECVKVGINANEEDDRGRTALILASIGGHTKAIIELAHVNADANHYDENGLTAYLYAKNMNNAAVMSTLAGIGADPEAERGEMQPERGWGGANPALMDAIEKLKVGRVRTLLRSKRDAQDADFAGNTPLMVLCSPLDPENRKDVEDKPHKMAQILDMLLQKGADPNAVNANGQTALMRAAADLAKNDLSSGMVYEIMKKGAYLNDRHGFTHANALCYCGYESMDAKDKQEERWGWRLLAAGARVRDIQTTGIDALYASCDSDSRKKQKDEEAKKKQQEEQEEENSTPGQLMKEGQKLVDSTVNGMTGMLPSDASQDGADGGQDDAQDGAQNSAQGSAQEGGEKKDSNRSAQTNQIAQDGQSAQNAEKNDNKESEDLQDYVFPGMCRLLGADPRQKVEKAGSPNCTDALRNRIAVNSMRWFVRIFSYRPPNSAQENMTGGLPDNGNRANRGGNRGNRGGANRGGNRGGNGGNRGGNGGNRGGNGGGNGGRARR